MNRPKGREALEMTCVIGGRAPRRYPHQRRNSQNLHHSEVRAEQAASTKPQTLKLGLAVHADTIVVVRLLDHGASPTAQKFTPARFLEWFKTQFPLAVAVCLKSRAIIARRIFESPSPLQ